MTADGSVVTTVTVVVPARNEQDAISSALQAILDQDYPHHLMEVVVVDGCSEDETADRTKRILDGSDLLRWTVVSNPDRRTPSNLNRGLLWAGGDLIVRVDARSIIPTDYVRRVVAVMQDPTIVACGGRQMAVAADPASLQSRSIARALNNTIANGGSRYRNPRAPSGECDTAYLGVFRRSLLNELGGWSERFASNQDFELSRRLAEHGSIWYEAGLPVGYEPRRTYRLLFAQYRRFGRWKAIYWAETGDRPRPRQLALLAGPAMMGLVAIVLGVHRPRLALRAAVGAVAALIAVDAIAQEKTATPTERVGSATAMAVIGAGWWSGALQEFIVRRSGTRGR